MEKGGGGNERRKALSITLIGRLICDEMRSG